jgi:xanthine dehydrogenase YagR molybdenum-binding subunit
VVSPHAHALVTAVDTRKAEKLAGVKAVFVVKVQEGATLVDPSTEKNGRFPRVRYAGQCVAAVAATTPEIAEAAARLVEVRYQLLPAAIELGAAMAESAPLVYPGPVNLGGSAGGGGAATGLAQRGNIRGPTEQREGDVDAALAASAIRVAGTFRTQVQTHSPMETHGVVADWGCPSGSWRSSAALARTRRTSPWSCQRVPSRCERSPDRAACSHSTGATPCGRSRPSTRKKPPAPRVASV